MANPVTVSTRPQYLNANTLVYNMWDLRRYMDGPPPGPGVFGYEDWRVLPNQAAAGLSVDVGKTGVGLMQGWVRGSTRGGQGLYRLDNIDVTAATADTYLAQFRVDVAANSSGNPRIDIVVLEVLDAQHTGASSLAQIRVISGTPTAAATLDNRTGAAAVPTSAILLADIIIANLDATIDAVDIRDRRQYPLNGAPPAILTKVDQVTFTLPVASLAPKEVTISNATHSADQAAVAMFLSRRIVSATRIRWRYIQGGVAMAGNYRIGIYDASGRLIVETGSVAFTGALSTYQTRSETIAATTFDAGWYYVFFSISTSAGSVVTYGVFADISATTLGAVAPNLVLGSDLAGFAAPPTLLALADLSTLTATVTVVHVPLITLSVG